MSDRIHSGIFFLVEAGHFSSENPETRGKVATATLTSDEGFAAEKGQFMAGRRYWNGF